MQQHSEIVWNEIVAGAFQEYPIFVLHAPCRRARVTRFHRQPGLELHFSHSGRGSFHLENRVLPLVGRHVVILGGSQPHQVFADVTSGYKRTVVCIDTPVVEMVRSFFPDGQTPEFLRTGSASEAVVPWSLWRRLSGYLAHIHDEYRGRERGWEQSIFASVVQLIVLLERVRVNPIKEERPEDLVSRCLDVIESHLDSDINAEILARLLNVSPKHLSRVFNRAVGCGIRHYLKRRRIEVAKRMLLDDREVSVQEIAFLCGFKALSHFCRSFRELTGTTPTQFRQPERGD